MIEKISEFVRIRTEGSPFEVVYDVIVEVLKDGEWTYYSGYNSLSNDYAFTSAREAALRAGKVLDISA
jgi:hypothetical protein